MNFITMRHFFICLFTFSFLLNFAQSRAKFSDKFKVVSGGYYHNVLENYGLNGFYDPELIYFNDMFTQISYYIYFNFTPPKYLNIWKHLFLAILKVEQ